MDSVGLRDANLQKTHQLGWLEQKLDAHLQVTLGIKSHIPLPTSSLLNRFASFPVGGICDSSFRGWLVGWLAGWWSSNKGSERIGEPLSSTYRVETPCNSRGTGGICQRCGSWILKACFWKMFVFVVVVVVVIIFIHFSFLSQKTGSFMMHMWLGVRPVSEPCMHGCRVSETERREEKWWSCLSIFKHLCIYCSFTVHFLFIFVPFSFFFQNWLFPCFLRMLMLGWQWWNVC